MFDFLFRKSGGEPEGSIMDLIKIDAIKAALSDMAIEKANGMIAKAIAKSEFIVNRNGKNCKDNVYWMLNVKTNRNETATEFWTKTINKLLSENECVIVHLKGNLYRASKFSENKEVVQGKKYTDVWIESGDDEVKLIKTFASDDVIHLRNSNKKILYYLKSNLKIYNSIMTGLLEAKKISSVPNFSLDIEGQAPIIRKKKEDGTEETITLDKYKETVKEILSSENIGIITNQMNMKVNPIKVESNASVDDITKIAKEIFTECAYAYDIPRAVFLGEITEKADSTNEFITYAVDWIVEILNDAMTAALVGKEGFLKKNEKIWVDMSKYKHVDVIESAAQLEKLRGIGFSLDEIFELIGRQPLNEEFSRKRVITKNFTDELGGGEGEKKTTQ